MELDLGGIAKGFAVELAGGVMRRRGLSAFIDAGGNQYMVGTPAGKTTWTLGIKDPETPEHLLGTIDVDEGSVSTSAQGSNFLVANGRKYGHILDPRTLEPAAERLSVTIVAKTGAVADALSTAFLVLGRAGAADVLARMPEVGALFVDDAAPERLVVAGRPPRAFDPSPPLADFKASVDEMEETRTW